MIRHPPRSPLFPSPPLSRSAPPLERARQDPRLQLRVRAPRTRRHAQPVRHTNQSFKWSSVALSFWCAIRSRVRSEEHTSELQSQSNLVCRLLLEKKKKTISA